MFLGHLAIGEEALKRGDKAGAARQLMAAADAPVTDFLRYQQINMSLPRELVDTGERNAVAKFPGQVRGVQSGGAPPKVGGGDMERDELATAAGFRDGGGGSRA